jgi:hypothetical protein
MARLVLVLFAVFLLLTVLRGLRIFLAAFLRQPGTGGARPGVAKAGEMIRDPVCGTWIDRRLAVAGRRGEEMVPVCSEQCRAALEAQAP